MALATAAQTLLDISEERGAENLSKPSFYGRQIALRRLARTEVRVMDQTRGTELGPSDIEEASHGSGEGSQ